MFSQIETRVEKGGRPKEERKILLMQVRRQRKIAISTSKGLEDRENKNNRQFGQVHDIR